MQYATQEEWKKAKAKEERDKKAAAKLNAAGKKSKTKADAGSPKANKQSAPGKHGASLLDMFGSKPKSAEVDGSSSAVPEASKSESADTGSAPVQPSPAVKPGSPGFSYYLSDSKTRYSNTLPYLADQTSARMQCMLYKRLFDGVITGAKLHLASLNGEANGSADPTTAAAGLLAGDSLATTFTLERLCSSLSLNADVPLSDAFLADAIPLCESYDLELIPPAHASQDTIQNSSCTLRTTFKLMASVIEELCESAAVGYAQALHAAGRPSATSEVLSPVIADELTLVYRKRTGFNKKKRGKTGKESTKARPASKRQRADEQLADELDKIVEKKLDAKENGAQPLQQPPAADTESQSAAPDLAESQGADNDLDLSAMIQLSVAVEAEAEKLSQHTLTASESPAKTKPPSTPPKPSQESAAATEPATPAPTPSKAEGHVIGRVRFVHEADKLDAYLQDILAMWKGERELRGVTEQEINRCSHCEYIDGCEWRVKKQEELVVLNQKKREELERRKKEAAAKIAAAHADEAALLAIEMGKTDPGSASVSSNHPGPAKESATGKAEPDLWDEFDDVDETEWERLESQKGP